MSGKGISLHWFLDVKNMNMKGEMAPWAEQACGFEFQDQHPPRNLRTAVHAYNRSTGGIEAGTSQELTNLANRASSSPVIDPFSR